MADVGSTSVLEWVGGTAKSLVNLTRPVMNLTQDVAPIAKSLAPLAPVLRWAPIASAVIAGGMTVNNFRKDLAEGNPEKATYEAITGIPEVVANLIPIAGPAVGSAIREGLRAEVVSLAGENNAPEKSFLRKGFEKISTNLASEPPQESPVMMGAEGAGGNDDAAERAAGKAAKKEAPSPKKAAAPAQKADMNMSLSDAAFNPAVNICPAPPAESLVCEAEPAPKSTAPRP